MVRTALAQVSPEFCEGLVDRIEIGAVGRQEQNPCALVADGLLGDWALVSRQVVHDDDVASSSVEARWVSA